MHGDTLQAQDDFTGLGVALVEGLRRSPEFLRPGREFRSIPDRGADRRLGFGVRAGGILVWVPHGGATERAVADVVIRPMLGLGDSSLPSPRSVPKYIRPNAEPTDEQVWRLPPLGQGIQRRLLSGLN